MKDHLTTVRINERSIVPKYLQLAEGLLRTIRSGEVRRNEMLPSLHEICTRLDISKGSAEKAYGILKRQGIVGSLKGKGYYVKRELEGCPLIG